MNSRKNQPFKDSAQLPSGQSSSPLAGRKPDEDDGFVGRILETGTAIIYVVDLDTLQLIYSSRQLALDLGYPEEKVREFQNSFFGFLHPDDRSMMQEHLEKMRTVSSDELVLEIVYRLIDHAGGHRWYRDRSSVLRRNNGQQPTEMLGVCDDITELMSSKELIDSLGDNLVTKETETLERNEDLRALGRLNLTDNQALQTLYTNLEYIATRDAQNLSETGKGNIRKAQASLHRMKLQSEDVHEYLDLYNVVISKSPVRFDSILDQVLFSMKSRLDEYAIEILRNELPEMQADSTLLKKLMEQLLDNCIVFRKEGTGSRVSITTSSATRTNPMRQARRDTAYNLLSFTDNGIGFREDESERLFELFYKNENTKKYKGTGVGLSICKKIMGMHEGFIKAESISGSTSIHCFFPAQ